MGITRQRFLLYIALLLTLGFSCNILITQQRNTTPFAFGWKWDQPIDVSQFESGVVGVYETSTPPNPLTPFKNYIIIVDEDNMLIDVTAYASFKSMKQCVRQLNADKSLWYQRYQRSPIKMTQINTDTKDLKTSTAVLEQHVGDVSCAKFAVGDIVSYEYELNYTRE